MPDQLEATKEQRGDHDHAARSEQGEAPVEEQAKSHANGSLGKAGDAAAKRISGGKHTPAASSGGPDFSTAASANAFLVETAAKDPAAQAQAIGALTAAQRSQLANALPGTLSDGSKAQMKMLFDDTPDAETDTLKTILGKRFQIGAVGKDKGKGGVDWEALGLRRTWQVLEALPPAHVEGNPAIAKLVRYKVDKDTAAEGYYSDDVVKGQPDNRIAIGYNPDKIDVTDQGDFTDQGDPMFGTIQFNSTVRHEVGHAVDSAGKFSDTYCIGNAAGGDWRDYQDGYEKVLGEMIAASAAGIAASSHKDDVVAVLEAVLKGRAFSKIQQKLEAAPFWSKLSAAEQGKILADPVVSAIKHNNTDNEPWMDGNGGLVIAGRVFQESYNNAWTSYAEDARSRKVSKYQFRAPGEWFAEAYSAYYEPVGKDQPKGSNLAKTDPKAKDFFDKSVDNMTATKGGGAAADGKKKKAS